MRSDGVVAGQLIGPGTLRLEAGSSFVRLDLAPADEGVSLSIASAGAAACGCARLPSSLQALVGRDQSKIFLQRLRRVCVAPRSAGRAEGRVVTWQLPLSGGFWEIRLSEMEEHPPLDDVAAAIQALVTGELPAPPIEPAPPPRRLGRLLLVTALFALGVLACWWAACRV